MLSKTEHRLCDLIDSRADDLLRQLGEHVAIPTGKNHAPGLKRYRDMIVGRLQAIGARVSTVPGAARPDWLDTPALKVPPGDPPPTVLARSSASGEGPRLLVVGHLDTVHDPQGPFQRLELSPDGAQATGPGAADMKGGIMIAVNALEVLAEAGVPLRWTVLLNSDEETGSYCSDPALKAAAAEHDVGIVVEPALPGGALALTRVGSGQFKVEVFGRAAHAGRDFASGISAVVQLAETIGRLHALAEPDRGVVVNVGPLVGGTVTNTVPDYAACWGNVRYPDAEAGRSLAAAIEELATGEAMPRVVVHRHWNRPAKPPTEAVRRFAAEAQHAAEDLGAALPLESTGGVCDGNILQDAGLPTLDSLGVCGGNLHRTDEFIEVESLVARCRLLAVLMARIGEGRIVV